MDTEDYRLLLRVVEPVLEAIEEHRLSGLDLALDSGDDELPQEVRDEAALVIATAVTGRLDNEVVELDVDDNGPVRIVTDAATARCASSPTRRPPRIPPALERSPASSGAATGRTRNCGASPPPADCPPTSDAARRGRGSPLRLLQRQAQRPGEAHHGLFQPL